MHRFDDAKDFELAKDDGLLYATWEANVVTSKNVQVFPVILQALGPYGKKKDSLKMR
jgi:hypothetical protein